MNQAIQLFNIFLPILYLGCLFVYGYVFFNPKVEVRRISKKVLRGTLILHLIFLILVLIRYQRVPMANLFEALSFLGFAVAVVYVYLEYQVREESAGFFVLMIVFLFQALSSGFETHREISIETFSNRAVFLHVGSALVSYSALAISALFSAMYLMQYHNLKKHRFGLIFNRLPSLHQLNRLCYLGALVGFILLTFSMITGFLWAFSELDEAKNYYTKIVIVAISWAIYATLVGLKLFRNLQGRRMAYFSLIGFLTTLISLLVAFWPKN